jgi:hypothetical protein
MSSFLVIGPFLSFARNRINGDLPSRAQSLPNETQMQAARYAKRGTIERIADTDRPQYQVRSADAFTDFFSLTEKENGGADERRHCKCQFNRKFSVP